MKKAGPPLVLHCLNYFQAFQIQQKTYVQEGTGYIRFQVSRKVTER